MYITTWYKLNCPSCKAVNWICGGDTSDLTSSMGEASRFRCWKCKEKHYWIEEDEFSEEDYRNPNCIEGLEHPDGVNDLVDEEEGLT